ncbi:hypothetical protein ILUMI_07827 [Ignelater luminosus]|uniref:Targeting protein for Xklp2 n=1 Tax=Ignelater luminosus TaxID=2038154 RepID=A0A8K0D2R9_IGNLU|nr:hypothetical protein ILUMI_07827 [Ignelater luminosus]
MDRFSYNAPDFLDFSKDLDHEDVKTTEKFFEMEHENHSSALADSPQLINDSGEQGFEYEFYTPLKKTPGKFGDTEKCLRQNPNGLRKSLSMDCIVINEDGASSPEINNEIDIISNGVKKLSTFNNQKTLLKQKISNTMLSRGRSISKDHIDKLSQPKCKCVSQENLCLKKYVSMAEAINQFHLKTPKRFHSTAKTNENLVFKHSGPVPSTIPQSPALATKHRARPNVVLSREEQELKELEEAKKYQIKARPVNPKILNGPVQLKCNVTKKPSTKPEPFKLTEVPLRKTLISPTLPPYEFHAKPLPKSTLEPPKPIIKNILCTNPVTPNLMKRHGVEHTKNEVVQNGIANDKPHTFKLGPTKPLPFSFEQRDKEVLKKREKLINEVIQEEKKAREFHARPAPSNIFKSPASEKSFVKHHHSDASLLKTFKAKPAKVLQMKPFEPKKEEHTTEFSEFTLSTERRAKEREMFEQKKKEKEEELARILKEKEEEMQLKEKEELKKLRILTEYKAQPIRRYREVKPVASKPLTTPISPKFSSKDNIAVDDKENSSSHV